MYPYIEFLGREIYTYPLMAAAGAIAAGVFACRNARTYGKQRQDDMIVLLLFSAVGAFIGGHLLYAVVSPQSAAALSGIRSVRNAIGAAASVFGGSVFYGGLAGGMAAGALYLKLTRHGFTEYSDIAAPSIPLFHAFGRLGCFLGGCCYGAESSVGFISRRALIESANGVRRLPVQLIESAFLLLLCAVLTLLYRRDAVRGRLLYIYLVSYGVFRFVIEFWRGDEYRGIYLGLSTSQWISVFILAVCAAALSGVPCRLRSRSSRI
ncbi:MAG: prolipoprotein diacylglyceryl transferase [Oscillospiraceae bacterium]|jgi:phosphatidylglycerol:prolipoprotein diacylglycerol transferase|nr:prolipoprotein diacylglyceryl transferase [Oscillospiraceae bacterium]